MWFKKNKKQKDDCRKGTELLLSGPKFHLFSGKILPWIWKSKLDDRINRGEAQNPRCLMSRVKFTLCATSSPGVLSNPTQQSDNRDFRPPRAPILFQQDLPSAPKLLPNGLLSIINKETPTQKDRWAVAQQCLKAITSMACCSNPW